MSKLPKTAETIETLEVKQEAKDMVDNLIERNFELEEIFQNLQPLLYALSVKIYGDDDSTVTLGKLVEDSIKFINGEKETLQ